MHWTGAKGRKGDIPAHHALSGSPVAATSTTADSVFFATSQYTPERDAPTSSAHDGAKKGEGKEWWREGARGPEAARKNLGPWFVSPPLSLGSANPSHSPSHPPRLLAIPTTPPTHKPPPTKSRITSLYSATLLGNQRTNHLFNPSLDSIYRTLSRMIFYFSCNKTPPPRIIPPEKIIPMHPRRCGSLTTKSVASGSTQSRMRSVPNSSLPRAKPPTPTVKDLPRTPKDLKGPVGTHWDPKRTQKDLKRTRSGPAWDLLFYLILACRLAQLSISKSLIPPRPIANIFLSAKRHSAIQPQHPMQRYKMLPNDTLPTHPSSPNPFPRLRFRHSPSLNLYHPPTMTR